jgi:flagellar hook-associated protein 2
MAGTSSINGVISGLNTDEIITKLLELEKAPITRLQSKKDTLNAKISAWQDANTRILALKTKADTLASEATFKVKTFLSDDESVLKGSAGTNAEAGTYYLKVSRLARAQQQKSIGYADTSTTKVGTGSISIKIGNGVEKVITIDDTNNTLLGLKDAINGAGAGVSAAIVNDGSSTNPYRLVLTSNTIGEDGAITINTENLTGGTAPTFTIMQAAQNAEVTLGEGAGAITIVRNSNQISDLIPGVTLNLQKVDTTKTITVTIGNDTEALKQNIKDFVNQYNNLINFVNEQFKYDTTTNTSGTLFSDGDLQTIQADLVSKAFNAVDGLDGPLKMLSQIGITSSSGNILELDETKLDEVLADNVDNVKFLFATVGKATSSNVSLVSVTEKTKSTQLDSNGKGVGYAINITTAATQGWMKAGVAQTANLGQDELLTVNGIGIQLTANMSPDQVVAKINEFSAKTGVTAARSADGYLTLTNKGYGSQAQIIVKSSVTGPNSTGFGNAMTSITAGVAQTQTLVQDEKLTINGVEITLKSGWSQSEVVTEINKHTSETGVKASLTEANGTGTGNYLTLTSSRLGSSSITAISSVSNGGGTPATGTSGIGNVQVTESSAGGETGTGTSIIGTATSERGKDVAGTINGEPATGTGQTLTGNSGNENTDGLSILITGQTTGSYGTIQITKGIASMLSNYLDYITMPTTGLVSSAKNLLQSEVEYIDDDIEVAQQRVSIKQELLVQKFAAMEAALGQLNSQSSQLASSLSAASSGWKS